MLLGDPAASAEGSLSRLLYVGELMGENCFSFSTVGVEDALREVEMTAEGDGIGAETVDGSGGVLSGMDADVGETGAELLFESSADP